jgi:hypothetical protein
MRCETRTAYQDRLVMHGHAGDWVNEALRPTEGAIKQVRQAHYIQTGSYFSAPPFATSRTAQVLD